LRRECEDGAIDFTIHPEIVGTDHDTLTLRVLAATLAGASIMLALVHQLGFFVIVGCAAAATHWLIAVGCVEYLGLTPLAGNVVGWLIAFFVSFWGHFRFTFRQSEQVWHVAARRFFFISALGFAVNQAAYAVLLHITHVSYEILLAGVLIGVAAMTFLLSRLWAFRHKTPS